MLRKLALAALAIVFSLLGTSSAHAAGSGDIVVSINPSEQSIDLRPGDNTTGSVTVYNVGRQVFDFEVEAAPYRVKNNSYDADFITENAHTRLSNWITFPETHFSVEPGHAVKVEFNIEVPIDALGGGQYAAVIIRTDTASDTESAVQIIPQLASLIYGHVKGAEANEDGEMTEHKFPTFILGDDFKLSSSFTNYGNVDFRVTETMTIRDFFTNKEVFTPASISEDGYNIGTISATVLPETTRTMNQVWDGAPQLGFFRVKQTIEFLDEELVFEHVVFICPIWLIVLVGLFLLLLIAWIVSHIISRRHDAPQVL